MNGYGTPPDNPIATNGVYDVAMYNDSNFHVTMNIMSTSGAFQGAFTMCDLEGFTSCGDPQIVYDRASQRWIYTFFAFGCSTCGGVVGIGVSDNSNPLSGSAIWALGKVTTGSYDAPRLGISSDKVIITVDRTGCTSCSSVDIWVLNKSELYSMNGFNFDTFSGSGTNWDPVNYTSNEATTLFEAPDSNTGNSGAMETYYVTGPQGGTETWIAQRWYIANDPNIAMYAVQPGTADTLDADSNEFDSAAYSGGVLWVTGNDQCSNGQLCPVFIVFDISSNNQPTQVASDFEIQMSDGSDLFYPALETTVTRQAVLGVVDYTCASCPHYGSSGTFQLTPSGGYQGGAYEDGNSTIAPPSGQTSARWGDFNSCSYMPNTNPAQATCIGEYAFDGVPQQEVCTVSYS